MAKFHSYHKDLIACERATAHENGGRITSRRTRRFTSVNVPDYMTLDEVDVSREIGSDFHANGLLANLRLVPDLHEISSKRVI
jgi:hypothetical protein